MNKAILRAAGAAAVLCAAFLSFAAQAPSTSRLPVNAAGQPVRNADGSPITYRRQDLTPAPAVRAAKAPAPAGSAPGPALGGLANWGFAAYGSSIGTAGLVSATLGGETEVYTSGSNTTFGPGSNWYALRWSRSKLQFDQVYVSDAMPSDIRRILLARMANGTRQIVVALASGVVRRYDQQSKALVGNEAGACASRNGLQAVTAADLDGNGSDELISVCGDQSLTVEGAGYAGWALPGVGGTEIVVGQMDADPALEIATTSGRVIDSGTRAVQWTWSQGFGNHLAIGDVDGDGLDELIVAESWYWIYAYDVDRQLPKWSLRTDHDIGAIALADIDGDGTRDLLVGDGQWGAVSAYSAQTQQFKGSVANPEHGVTQIAVADLDGDGKPELLWGAGATSTGPDHLYVANWTTKTIQWQNMDLVGPFIGPVMGDLDGDGIPEIVIASFESDAGYSSGRLIVFDSRTLAVRAVSPGVSAGTFGWTGVHALKLRDVDGDGRLDIVVGTDRLYDGLVEAYSFSPSNAFTLVFSNTTRPSGAPVLSVEVADVDGDGRPEVLAGVGYAHSGQLGYYLYAYDRATGAEKWHTLNLGGAVFGIVVGDFDGDGQLDIATAVRGRGVYIFAAATHELKALIEAPLISSLTRMDAYTVQRLLIGQTDGNASLRAFDGGQLYPEVQRVQFGPDRIDGITVGSTRTWWVAQGGVLARYAGSNKLWESANYGAGFGTEVLAAGSRSAVLSAGGYGLHRVAYLP